MFLFHANHNFIFTILQAFHYIFFSLKTFVKNNHSEHALFLLVQKDFHSKKINFEQIKKTNHFHLTLHNNLKKQPY